MREQDTSRRGGKASRARFWAPLKGGLASPEGAGGLFWGVKDNPSAALGSSSMTSMRLISFCDKATRSCFITQVSPKDLPAVSEGEIFFDYL